MSAVPVFATSQVAHRILTLRDQRVMIDADLAELYGVETRAINQAVRRNPHRFPADFMFRLTRAEKTQLITNCDHLAKLKFSSALPCAFTEHGALMLASVLNSARAVEVSLLVVRAFVQVRRLLGAHRELSAKLDELDRRIAGHDRSIADIVEAIRALTEPPEEAKRPIGFTTDLRR